MRFFDADSPYDGDNTLPDEEQVIDEFLGEKPRARDLRRMRTALEQRRETFRQDRERAADANERAGLTAKIKEIDRQIAAIRQEEAITAFVEDSVRVTLHRPSRDDLDEE